MFSLSNIACSDSKDAFAFHCAAGKDRTGFVSAVVLGLLEASREVIDKDYLHSLTLQKMIFNENEHETSYFTKDGELLINVSTNSLLESYGSFNEYANFCCNGDQTLVQMAKCKLLS